MPYVPSVIICQLDITHHFLLERVFPLRVGGFEEGCHRVGEDADSSLETCDSLLEELLRQEKAC